MRPVFTIGVKLIGLLVLYWASQHIAPIISSVRLFWIELPASALPFDPTWNLITYFVSFMIAVFFGTFLVFRGENLARRVEVPEAASMSSVIAPIDLLQSAIVVAGLILACNAVPRLLVEAFVTLTSSDVSRGVATTYGRIELFQSAFQAIFSLFFVFRSKRVAQLITDNGASTAEVAEHVPPDAPETRRAGER